MVGDQVWGLATSRMLAAATDFHHVRLIGFLAVLATVLTVLLGRAIAWPMLALVRCLISHRGTPSLLFGAIQLGEFITMLSVIKSVVKTP